jgi:hypothetical protein
MLIIALQKKKSTETTATRPVSEIAEWKTTVYTSNNKENHKKKNTNKQ